MSKKLLTNDAFVKKRYTLKDIYLSNKSIGQIYYSNVIDIELSGYEIYSVNIENWMGATHLFNLYVPNYNSFQLFSEYETHIDKLDIIVVYRVVE